jgi:hypothetical protein
MPGSAITPGTITITQLESNVATVVSTGGGPKITNIQVTDNAYTVLDDTAVDITGGYITITGTGFVTGCSVIVGQLPAASVTFISSTEVRAQLSAQSAGTYIVYLVNPDGGVGIRVNGVTHSASPAWQTASGLPDQYDGVAINLSLVATDATSYTITSGSLPPGLSLNSNTGVISGTVSGVANDTLYTFTVRATDAQLQDSPRTFTVTITVSDPYFRLTTLLLSGSAVSANTVIKDSSTNNFNLTVYGDARASNRTPYGSGWSNLFSSNRLNIATTGFAPGTGNFTVEAWIYPTSYNSSSTVFTVITTGGLWLGKLNSNWVLRAYNVADQLTTTTLPMLNTWTHVAWVRNGSTATIYFNGNSVVSGTVTYNFVSGGLAIGDDGAGTSYFLGYISNLRYTTTAVYTANFTPATTNLTALAGTQLLTCQDNRFRDTSANAYTITTTGTPTVSSFNPFNITNTGVNGSAYFDGTGDYISSQSSTAFAFDTNSYTIEFWFNASNTQTGGASDYTFLVDCRTVSGGDSPVILVQNGSIGFQTESSGLNVTASLVPYRWYHAAMVRDATNNKLWCFLDGTALVVGGTTYSGSTSAGTTARSLVIGARYSIERHYNGYISDLRVLKGTALYTSNFTPPTQPLTAITNTQLLTLQYDQPHNNHTFLDSSSNQFVVTRNGNATQGTFSPFSPVGWSAYFPGSSKLVFGSSSAWTFGTGDWTVEHWMMLPTLPAGTISYIDMRQGGALTNHVVFQTYSTGGAGVYVDSSPTAFVAVQNLFTPGQWGHVAYVRESGVIKIYFNGTLVASVASSVNMPAATPSIGGEYQGTNYLTGYISNLRVSKSARYTANFTPGTSSLSSSGASVLTLNSNRFVDITGNTTISVNTGSPSVVAFSPFAPTAVYSPVTHGGSAYFDGDSDQLTVPNHPGFDLSTADFTLSFWYYPTNSGTEHRLMSYQNGAVSNSNYGFYCTKTSGNNFYAGCVNGSSIYGVTSSNTVQINAWNYCVVTRTGTTWTVYLNGVSTTSSSFPSSFNNPSGAIWYIGSDGGSGTTALRLNGYLSNIRLIKGNIIPSPSTIVTAPVTATTDTQLLLNFTDSGIIDSTGRQVLETLADAKSTSVVTKFTGGSMSFDGTGDYLQSSAALSELVFLHNGTPWTVDGWFYTGSTSAQYILSTDGASASVGLSIGLNDTSTRDIVAVIYRGVSGSWVQATGPTNSWSLNTWTHFAVTFDSSKNLTVYVNGVQVATASGSSFSFSSANPSYPLVVGRYQSPTPGGYFNGYISDLRVTRGYARYTANFTAPTVPARLK